MARPRAPRTRRTQAERSATTRARIVRAVVECVGELGFQRTTAGAIARRAGVTWGAVQHHYGGKDGILVAVLDDTFARFAERFDGFPAALPLRERTARFVDCAWAHFGSPHYRTTLEILLHTLPTHTSKGAPGLQGHMLDAWDALWGRIFADHPLPRRRRAVLAQYTVSVLTGLAMHRVLQGPNAVEPRPHLALLAATLVNELASAAR
ncbi:TetR/AcrR family transcriptional regulator [bacterium]|nr:TetR/AcrR family transcriptional regulator [bacterium]